MWRRIVPSATQPRTTVPIPFTGKTWSTGRAPGASGTAGVPFPGHLREEPLTEGDGVVLDGPVPGEHAAPQQGLELFRGQVVPQHQIPFVTPAQWSITAHSPNSGVIASTTTSARSERETAWKREESSSGYRDGSTKVTVSLPRFRLEKVRSDSVPFLPSPFA